MNQLARRAHILIGKIISLLILLNCSTFANASLQIAINDLLEKAAQDLRSDRLMRPVNRNAVDRYRAVLLLDKSNRQAVLGLRKVVERYLALAKSQSVKGAYASAQKFVDNAEKVGGKSAQISALRASIIKAERVNGTAKPIRGSAAALLPPGSRQRVFRLNPADLSARNSTVVAELSALAKRVQSSREYVLIYARNDAEGRWIYQQMRRANPHYRMRGDIKRDKKPRILLDKPLD